MIIQFKRFWNSLSPDLRWILLAIFLSGIAEGLTANFHTLYLQYLKAKPQEIGATLGIAGVATRMMSLRRPRSANMPMGI